MTEQATASPWEVAAKFPDRLAIVMADTGQRLTYGEMIGNANRLANRLIKDGVQQGDCVAIFLENRVEYLEAVWAAKQIGAYYVCIPRGLSLSDARYMIGDCNAKVLISSQEVTAVAAPIAREHHPAMLTYMLDAEETDCIDYQTAIQGQPDTPVVGRCRGNSMLYSSGTTGRPKGIKHPLINVSPNVPPPRHAYLVKEYGFSPETVFIDPGPFYHTAPLRFMMHVQREGGTAIGFSKFDAETVLRAIETWHATNGFFVPTMFVRMLDLPAEIRENIDVCSMRYALHGAAPISPAVKQRMIDWWGPVIYEMYGGTESIGTTVINSHEWLTHRGSVGRPSSVTRIRIEAPDGSNCPPGVEGLVLMTQGKAFEYHGDPKKTAEATRDGGWGTLGDIGYLDEEGYLYLTDRASNLIISGGVNIYPQEAENVLSGHPEVQDAAVIGIPHPVYGEEVHALIVPRKCVADFDRDAFAEQLIAFCRNEIGKTKSPRSIEFVAELPRSEAGKIIKSELKKRYWPDGRRLVS